MTYHVPVLLKESIEGLSVKPNGIYVDVTFGGGGHSREIISRLSKKGVLVGFDQDVDAERNIINDARFLFIMSNYKYIKNFLKYHSLMPVDGIIADLGVSSHHFDEPKRGFSFRFEGDLDMRMNAEGSRTAEKVINEYDEKDLIKIFREYGELKDAGRLARAIIKEREERNLTKTLDLIDAVRPVLPVRNENKMLAQLFQAVRIEVNQELESLKEFLKTTLEVLKPGGRLVIITYHSLEDRLVKNFMKSGNFGGEVAKDFYGNPEVPFKLVNRKVIVPQEQEIAKNNRARSAKLRIAEKL